MSTSRKKTVAPLPDDERLLDLLAARATEGLSDEQQVELDRLLAAHDGVSADALEPAAAAVHLSYLAEEGDSESMPQDLRSRVLAAAEAHLPAAPADAATPIDEVARRRTRHETAGQSSERPASWTSRGALGWYAAAAMLIVTVLVAWPAPVEPSAAQERERLLERSDVIQVAWNRPDAPGFEDVVGDVVWSESAQQGYMRLENLPVNDPSTAQYQLWIVDPSRDDKPVDGGVFDVASNGEVIVPIDAKLRIDSPAAFAITREKPGGVVVSAGPLLVVAPVTG